MKKALIELLHAEVKPAMGCTEPVAVTLAVAKARSLGQHEAIQQLNIEVSPNIYKNGLAVGIPKSDDVGILKAGAIGALEGDPSLGLKIYESIEAVNERADALIESGVVRVQIADTDEKVFIKARLLSEKGESVALIQGMHHHFSYLAHDGQVVLEDYYTDGQSGFDILSLSVQEILDEVEQAEVEELRFLLEGLEMNAIISKAGQNTKLGLGVGYTTKQTVEKGLLGDDLANKAMYYTAAASDARMSGISLPVMSSNGSGNNGLTAILPILAYVDAFQVSEEDQIKALALSHLLNCYIKAEIGRLSALCSCGIAAATGSASAIAWLMGGNYGHIAGTIQNMIANVSGMICDGAKNSCALKLATAASIGVKSAIWALNDTVSQAHDGIVGRSVEESIQNLGILSREGMQLTDHTILSVMKGMQ